MGADDSEETPIGDLFGRLIDDGKAYGRAELNLVRARAEVQVERARKPAIFGGLALFFAIGGVIALAMTLVLWLGSLLGWLGGGLIATAIILCLAGLSAFLAKHSWERG